MNETIVVTGATGFVGSWTLGALCDHAPDARIVALVRPAPGKTPLQRVEASVRQAMSAARATQVMQRVEAIAADLGEERCGMDEATYAELATRATRIIHGAASVRFDSPVEEARAINVEGTRRAIALATAAQKAGVLRAFTYIGTAFVAGARDGLVLESELEAGQPFRNSYERTKCEAERLVRNAQSDLPAAILRPSIVAGDSVTGVTTSFKMMYWPLKVYANGWWRTIPGRPDAIVDVVPVDYVANSVAALAFDDAARGGAFHICAGPKGAAQLDEIAQAASRFFHAKPPRYVDPATFSAVIRPLAAMFCWGRSRQVLSKGEVYRPYFGMRTSFDISEAERALAPKGLHAPRVMDFIDRMLRYCEESDWGRRPVTVH